MEKKNMLIDSMLDGFESGDAWSRTNLSQTSTSSDTITEDSVRTKKMLIVAGVVKDVTIEIYDFEKQLWLQGPKTFKRRRSSSVLLNTGKKVYMIGGRDDDSNKVDVFDLKHEKWSKCSDLLEGRDVEAAAILDGDIYVSAGGSLDQKSWVKLDQQTGSWIRMADLIERRSSHSMCAMDGKIYAVGGSDKTGYLPSVECYSPEMNSWSRVPDMSVGKFWPGVAGLDGKMYVVGGWNECGWIKCVEVFNAADQKWTRLADLNLARVGLGVVAVDGLIYAIGGFDGSKYLDSVEVYDPRIDTWTILPNKLRDDIDWVSAAVIDSKQQINNII